jgi:uncharacterized protein (DUF2344 family)
MKIRCKHKKVGLFRFLSGIQLALIMDEGLRRTGYDFEYTNGFNPRIKVNFSLPVPVGVASISEWFDVSLKEEINEKLFMKNFNSKIQDELQILSVEKLSENSKPVISLIHSYEYKIYCNESAELEKINYYSPEKGKILNFNIEEKQNLKVLTLKATADQENYFNVNKFLNYMDINPILTIKTKTYMG